MPPQIEYTDLSQTVQSAFESTQAMVQAVVAQLIKRHHMEEGEDERAGLTVYLHSEIGIGSYTKHPTMVVIAHMFTNDNTTIEIRNLPEDED